MNDDIKAEAKAILDTLAFTPFENCQPLSREFENVPARLGIYAFRHRFDGLLYVGKAKSLTEFRGIPHPRLYGRGGDANNAGGRALRVRSPLRRETLLQGCLTTPHFGSWIAVI